MDKQFQTLNGIAKNPERIIFPVSLTNGAHTRLRPLFAEDESNLALFFEQLSQSTSRFYSFSGSAETHAQELCQAINRYDKLRCVLEQPGVQGEIIDLIEFSLAILEDDCQRYVKYGLTLDAVTDCRYGLCLSDEYQNQGIGHLLFQCATKIASLMGKQRIILWGGVYTNNALAIRHYRRCGFIEVGEFINPDGKPCLDMIYTLRASIPSGNGPG
jgi:ribosomal protein S18 acetylase RimI-like enzyme